MLGAAWAMYLASVILTAGYFLLIQRRFDFLTIAWIGAIFYFSPLFFGWVLQPGPDLSETIQPTVYLIATIYLVALAGTGILSGKSGRDMPASAGPGRRLSLAYLILALLGLAGSLIVTRGAIFNINKAVMLSQVGYFHILFEVAASLACLSAVIERRRWELATGILLLFIDLIIGFRVFVVLTALSMTLVLLTRDGPLYLYKKAPTYGSAAAILVLAMLSAGAIRPIIFDQFAKIQKYSAAPTAQKLSKTESETDKSGPPLRVPGQSRLTVSNFIPVVLSMILQSGEAVTVQATLVAIVQTGLSCSPSNIFKSLFLLVPPGMARFAPTNSSPPTFFDEYQPVLYPNINWGTGGNIWAEMLCRFGYIGMFVFGALLMLVLVGLNRLWLKSSPNMAAPLSLGGVIVAFYINRNDLHFTLQMLKWVGIVLLTAYLLSLAAEKVKWRARAIVPARPDVR